jgi:ABC-type antimicrobial peptide transport system permease subunit
MTDIGTQQEYVDRQVIRERLMAMLSLFFAAVALVLAGVGLYGVLNYNVVQRRREIGIRLALGAPAAHVARKVTAEVFGMLLLGAAAGLGLGLFAERYVEKLLFQVKATDTAMMALPIAILLGSAALASIPPTLAALRVDPVRVLRAD